MSRISLLLTLGLLPVLASAAAPVRPAKLGQCVACHGEAGRSRMIGTPHLAGQDATYLSNALNAYRDGRRQAAPMNAIANTLQPRDITALARWYAAQGCASVAEGRTPRATAAQGCASVAEGRTPGTTAARGCARDCALASVAAQGSAATASGAVKP